MIKTELWAIEFVTASHNKETYCKNLGASSLFRYEPGITMVGYSNISKAYNEANTGQLTCYVHHDVFLPKHFLSEINNAISLLSNDFGVVGVAGVKLVNGIKHIHGNILDRGRQWGSAEGLPTEVDTLDEMLLITHGDYKFDENLDQDFYGADICMQAKVQGRKNYAINAYCHHNSTREFGGRTENFYKCESYFREKWKDHLPIATTCTIVS